MNLAIMTAILYYTIGKPLILKPAIDILVNGYGLEVALKLWTAFFLLFIPGLIDWLLPISLFERFMPSVPAMIYCIAPGNTKPLLYGDERINRKLIMLPSNLLLWHLHFKRKNKMRFQMDLMKDFLNHWDTNQKKIPTRLTEIFNSLRDRYKSQGDEGLQDILSERMEDLKTMIKNADAWV